MKFSAIFADITSALAALALPTLPTAKVVPDNDYTDPNLLISQLACSNGPHGLMLKGYTRVFELPSYPRITGFQGASWGSPLCGTCWAITYKNLTMNVLVVDYAWQGFNLDYDAFLMLTKGTGQLLPEVDVTYKQVSPLGCGIQP